MEEITIHQVMGAHNAVVLSDADLNLVFVWNGISCFLVFQEVGQSRFTLVDSWSTEVRPTTLFEAQERCRYRLGIIRREHAAADAEPASPVPASP